MTTHFDLHSTTIARGVGAKPSTATVKRSMRWLVPAGLLAVGAVAIAATIGNDDGATTVRSLTPAAPAAEVSTDGAVSLRDAVAGVPDGGLDLGVISPVPSGSITPSCDAGTPC